MSKDHVLVRGRKDVLFRNKKRFIEVQALVARNDIADDDSVKTNNVIESNVQIIR